MTATQTLAAELSPGALETLLEYRPDDTTEALRARVTEALGLPNAIPLPALERMMEDEEFFHDLIATRSAPAMLEALIQSTIPDQPEAVIVADHSNVALMGKAARALASWSRGGFSRVDDAVRDRRLAACLGCDRLSAPPEQLAYKIAGLLTADNRSCSACGCVVSAKARLPRENCPLPDGSGNGLSRWGEPLKTAAKQA